jgi:hypothetical protein
MNKWLIFIILTVTNQNCRISEKDMVGKFYAKHGFGEEFIELKADRTYLHFFKDKNGKDHKRYGEWKIADSGRFLVDQISLDNFIVYVDPFSDSDERVNLNNTEKGGGSRAYISTGSIRVYASDDFPEYNFYRDE